MNKAWERQRRENERHERREREHEDRMQRERDREETRRHREWQREESLRRELERHNRSYCGHLSTYTPPAGPVAPPKPAQTRESGSGGISPLGAIAVGVAVFGVAAKIASIFNEYGGKRGPSSLGPDGELEIHCRAAPPRVLEQLPAPVVAARKRPPALTADKVIAFLVLAAAFFIMGIVLANLAIHTWNGYKHS